jgi:transposase
MPLNEHDKDLIQAMFYDDCDVNTVAAVVRHAPRSTLYRMQKNIELFGQVRRPSSALKRMGAPRKITPIMREYLIDLLSERNDLWQEELVFELWCQFDIAVNKSTICRLLKEQELTNKVNTRIASRQSSAQQGVYLEQLATLMGQGLNAGIEPMDMLVYLDESACSEKVMFRRRSWSQIGLPAYTRSELVNKTRCSVLPALDVNGYLYGSSLVVEGSVTQAIYEYWLETVILPQCEPFPSKRSIVVMDNCSTHHSDKVWLSSHQIHTKI